MLAEDPISEIMLSVEQTRTIHDFRPTSFLPLAGPGILATINEDGTPLLTKVVAFYDGDSYYLQTTADAPELDNLRRDPRLSMHVVNAVTDRGHVILRGRAAERRIQLSHGLVYVRIALDPDGEPVMTDTDA
jgi:hypothetical protein